MYINAELTREINVCVGALNELVIRQGHELTDPHVVQKSMELDLLVLLAMKSQINQRKKQRQKVPAYI